MDGFHQLSPGPARYPATGIWLLDCDARNGPIPDEVREGSCMLRRLSLNRSSPLIVHYSPPPHAAYALQLHQQRLELSPDANASCQISRTRFETRSHCRDAGQGTLNKRSTHA